MLTMIKERNSQNVYPTMNVYQGLSLLALATQDPFCPQNLWEWPSIAMCLINKRHSTTTTCSNDKVSGLESHWDLVILSAERGDEKDIEHTGTRKSSDPGSPVPKDGQTY